MRQITILLLLLVALSLGLVGVPSGASAQGRRGLLLHDVGCGYHRPPGPHDGIAVLRIFPGGIPSAPDLAWTGGRIAEPRFLAPGSPWNTPLGADSPLDPSSRSVSAAVASMARGYGTALDVSSYSTPIYVVPAGQPTVCMRLSPHRGRVNPPLQAAFDAVPVPSGAQPAAGSDKLLVVYQPSTDTLWESWHTRLESDGWHFDAGGRVVDASESPGFYRQVLAPGGTPLEEPWWGASASSLTLAGSVITFRDLANGYIDHALAFELPHVWIRAGVAAWPAERTDGVSIAPDSVPEGARFRLDPNLDLASLHLPPLTRMIAVAAQRYGLIVRGGSSDITIDGQAPRTAAQAAAWQHALTASGFQQSYQALRSFPWSHLQLMKMSLAPAH